jgi:hypothetical protein
MDDKTQRQVLRLIRDPSITAFDMYEKRMMGDYANLLAVDKFRAGLDHKRSKPKSKTGKPLEEDEDEEEDEEEDEDEDEKEHEVKTKTNAKTRKSQKHTPRSDKRKECHS